jgi:uncharacterized repeat protein (TIGR03803 family)
MSPYSFAPMRRRTSCPLLALFALTAAFALHPPSAQAQTEQQLYNFCSDISGDTCVDGETPYAGLILAADGNFWGTTEEGGTYNAGIIFKLTPAGVITVVYNFAGFNSPDSGYPSYSLVQGPDGNLYGITSQASDMTSSSGTVFQVTPAGAFSTIFSFCSNYGGNCPNGAQPYAALTLGSDGNLYGTTLYGGANGYGNSGFGAGTVFKVSTAGNESVVYNFCAKANCTDGLNPQSSVLQGMDGNFYTTTTSGGSANHGAVLKITPAGSLTTLASLCTDGPCSTGSAPYAGLVQDSSGNFYGITSYGGNTSDCTSSQSHPGCGTVFKVSTANAVSSLYTFTGAGDGATPNLILQATDGNLYGTTQLAGLMDYGTLFKLTTGGTLSTLYGFCNSCGGIPFAPLIQGSDGDLYGTLSTGGTNSFGGTAFKLAFSSPLPAPVQLTLSESTVAANSPVTLSWKALNAQTIAAQQCYAFIQKSPSGAGAWSGKQSGTYSSSTHDFSGSSVITPTTAGTYTYALTCGGTVSGFATLTVTSGGGKTSSSTALIVTPSSLSVGQSTTLKATVTGSGSTPTGSVTFSADGATLATVSLNGSGVASLTATSNGLAPATYPVLATYNGNSSYNSSASKAVNVTLSKAPTATTLTASPTSVTPPASVTLTATVKRSATGTSGTPTGSVTFSTSGVTLATIALNSKGVATLTASSSGYPAAAYPIKAAYNGDASDTASTSSSVTVTVK